MFLGIFYYKLCNLEFEFGFEMFFFFFRNLTPNSPKTNNRKASNGIFLALYGNRNIKKNSARLEEKEGLTS